MNTAVKYISAALLTGFLLAGCARQAGTDALPQVISSGFVRTADGSAAAALYERPDPASEILLQLEVNEPLQIYQLRDGWFYVEAAGQRGFLPGDAVAFSELETAPAETAPPETIPAETTSAAETVPETEPQETGQPHSGTILFTEDEILAAAGVSYSGHLFFSTITGLNPYNCTAEVLTEPIDSAGEPYAAQKGIQITYTDTNYIAVEGVVHLHGWRWKDEAGGDTEIFDDADAYFFLDQYMP